MRDEKTLRDKFAMAAASGILANSAYLENEMVVMGEDSIGDVLAREDIVRSVGYWSYKIADAMLAARAGGEESGTK